MKEGQFRLPRANNVALVRTKGRVAQAHIRLPRFWIENAKAVAATRVPGGIVFDFDASPATPGAIPIYRLGAETQLTARIRLNAVIDPDTLPFETRPCHAEWTGRKLHLHLHKAPEGPQYPAHVASIYEAGLE